MILYHGSANNIEKTLKPNKAFDKPYYAPVVYLTDSQVLALLYAISPIDVYIKKHFNINTHCSAISAHICNITRPLTLMELYPNIFEDIYHKKAYIYLCNIIDSMLSKLGDRIYTAANDVDFVQKIEIFDVYNELLKFQQQGTIRMLNYENIDRWKNYCEYEHIVDCLNSRKLYCKTKEEMSFFEMVGKYFPIG